MRFAAVLLLLAVALLLWWSTKPADAQQEPAGHYQGKTAQWWAGKTTHWKRAAVKRGRTLATVKRDSRRRTRTSLLHGIDLAAVAYGQSATALRRVAFCESRFYLYARSSGGHLGPFQFAPSTWRSTPYAGFSVFDPIAAPLGAAWMWSRGRKGEWACR